MSLKEKTIQGAFWTFTEQISVKGLGFVVQIILARLLLPKDFGLIAMVTIFIGIGTALSESGMTQSLIRTKEPNQADFSTVFFLNVIVSFIVYTIIYLLAPYVSMFYSQPQLTFILRWFALVIPIRSFMGVQNAILTIKMDFKSQMLIQLPSVIISGIVAVVLAYQGYGVWVLVIMQILMACLITIQYWIYSDWRPILIFDEKKFKYHFNFGYKLMLTTFVSTFFNDIYNIIIGRYFTATTLGFYNRASTFQKFPSILSGRAINRVTYPLFSKLTHDIKELRHLLKRINKLIIYIYVPIMLFLIFNAEAIISLLLTDKWLKVVPLFQILCIGATIQPIQYYNTNIIKSFGDTGLILKINIFFRVITILGIIIVLPYGINNLVIFEAFNIFILVLIFIYFSGKYIEYHLRDQILDILPELSLAILTGFICWFITNQINSSDLVGIILFSVLYIVVYLTISIMLKFPTFVQIVNDLKPHIKKVIKF